MCLRHRDRDDAARPPCATRFQRWREPGRSRRCRKCRTREGSSDTAGPLRPGPSDLRHSCVEIYGGIGLDCGRLLERQFFCLKPVKSHCERPHPVRRFSVQPVRECASHEDPNHRQLDGDAAVIPQAAFGCPPSDLPQQHRTRAVVAKEQEETRNAPFGKNEHERVVGIAVFAVIARRLPLECTRDSARQKLRRLHQADSPAPDSRHRSTSPGVRLPNRRSRSSWSSAVAG